MMSNSHQPTFSVFETVAICLLCFLGMFALQLVGVYLAGIIHYEQAKQLDIGTLITLGSQNGVVVGLSVLFTALSFSLLSLSVVYFKVKTNNHHIGQSIKNFFGIKSPTLKGFIVSLINLIILMVISEIATVIADESPMDFLNELMNEQSAILLIIAIVLIAPIYEELIFRGLIFGAITHLNHKNNIPIALFKNIHIGKNTLIATLVSSLLFTLVHLQYTFFGMMLIFSMALLFTFVRTKYGLITSILMHMINNGVAMAFYLMLS